MGAVKQLLPLNGRPLLQHVLDTVQASQADDVIVVLGHAADRIQQQIQFNGARVVVNENHASGMGTSLKAGLGAMNPDAEAVLVVLADQPFVKPATLDRLIAEHRASNAHVVIPTYRGFRGNPVLIDRSLFPEMMSLNGDVGCRAIFGNHLERVVKLPLDDAGVLVDIDRQSDFEELSQSRVGKKVELPPLEHAATRAIELVNSPELVVVGRDDVALALARLARAMRFRVTLVDPFLTVKDVPEADRILHVLDFRLLEDNPDRPVVVASRGACDEEAIEQALMIKSSYVGLVASRKRGEEVRRALRVEGIAEDALARICVPAGLDIDAETPEEIALSILAQVTVERRGRAKEGA